MVAMAAAADRKRESKGERDHLHSSVQCVLTYSVTFVKKSSIKKWIDFNTCTLSPFIFIYRMSQMLCIYMKTCFPNDTVSNASISS